MHQLPFKPRTLTLAIATILLASQPVTKARAETSLEPGSEWSCQMAPSGSGWQCTVQPIQKGAMKRAPRPAVTPSSETHTAPKNKAEERVVSKAKTAKVREQLDWVPKEKLPETLRTELEASTPWCTGQYVEPARPGKNFKGNPDTAPIVAESDESSYDQNSIATLKGNVTVRQGNRQLKSDIARLDREKNYAEFEGNVIFREPGTLLIGDYGDMVMDTGRATIKNARYAMHESHSRGDAGEIVRNEDAVMELNGATYTTCAPGDNGWLLTGDDVTLDPNTGFGTAKGAVVRVQGLPIFYAPYMYFPIDDRRQSGFLYPSISLDSDAGFDMSLPYYWNIAPNYDATLTPRIIAKRGVALENEFRYLNENGEGEVGVAGLLNKDQLEKENPYQDQERWLVNLRHQQNFSERWTADLDYADASDKNYLKDFGTALNLSSPGPLNQRVGTLYQGGNDTNFWNVKLDAHKFKNMSQTSDDPYNKLPQLVLDGNWQAGETLKVGYLADYTYFSRDDDWNYVREIQHPDFNDPDIKESIYDEGYGITKAEGSRVYGETSVSYPMTQVYGFLTPELKVRSVSYDTKNLNKDEVLADIRASYVGSTFKDSDFTDSPTTTVPTYSLDGGLYFDRFTNLFGTEYTHTLEPRMKYLYTPYVEGQEFNPIYDTAAMGFSYSSLWQDNRFSGYDRIGDANQLSIGITTRLIEDDGFERMRFGIGQIVYFDDRKVYIANRLGVKEDVPNPNDDWETNIAAEDEKLRDELSNPTSPVASEFIYNFNRTMSLRQDLAWDSNENLIDNYGLTYRWKPEARKTLNLGFRYRDQVERYMKDEKGNLIPDASSSTKYKMAKNDLKQTDFSFAWPLPYTQSWSGLGRWQYDLTNKRNLEELVGVEYNSCCYQVRLFWRSWIEPDDNIDHPDPKSGIFLQFVLNGLGSVTGSSGNEYLEGIQGYEIREK